MGGLQGVAFALVCHDSYSGPEIHRESGLEIQDGGGARHHYQRALLGGGELDDAGSGKKVQAGDVGFVGALEKGDEFREGDLGGLEVFCRAFREMNHLRWQPRVCFEEFAFSAMRQSND